MVNAMTRRHLTMERIMRAEPEGEHLPLQCYPLSSTDKACIMPSDKGKICKGPRFIFIDQAIRVNLELRDK